jgi:hypothetical protein
MSEVRKHKARVSHKHKTASEWYLDVYKSAESTERRDDPFIPMDGELVIFDPENPENSGEVKRFKFGDGVTDVIALPFVAEGEWDYIVRT